jgi:hypothetical protein
MGVPTPHHRRQADFAEAAVHELPADAGLRANAPQQQGVMSRLAVLPSKAFLSYTTGRRDFVEGYILLFVVWSSSFFELRCTKRSP